MEVCEVDWCDIFKRGKATPYCEKHYMQMRRNRFINPQIFMFEGCEQCGLICKTKFCSRRCQTRFVRNRKEVATLCIVCDKEIPSSARSDKKTCSQKCYATLAYSRSDKSKHQVWSAARRGRVKNAEGSFTPTEWSGIMDLYDSKCLICGTKENISIDHVDSLYNGGTNWMWNLQPLCLSDNKKKWKSSIDYRTEIELEAQLNLSNYLVWQKAQIESGNAPKIKDYNETR